jgi:predicted GH43/DUF377 family glycosyl hydrolase
MTFVKKGVVLDIGAAGKIDDVNAYLPATISINNKLHMYYCAYDGSQYRIALAISEDGVHFVKKGLVLYPDGAGSVDVNGIYMISPIIINDKIYLYNEVLVGAHYQIAVAISDDGVNFVKKGIIIPIGAGGTFDDVSAFNCSAIVFNDKIHLYYCGYDGINYRQSLAISEDGVNFIKKGIVLPEGAGGTIDDQHTLGGVPLLINNKIYLYYLAHDHNEYKGALAISDDGVNFVKKGIVLPVGAAGEIDDKYPFIGCSVSMNNSIYNYYTAFDNISRRVGVATSKDGF